MVHVPSTLVGIMTAEPDMALDRSYLFSSSNRAGHLADARIIAGPAILKVTPGSTPYKFQLDYQQRIKSMGKKLE